MQNVRSGLLLNFRKNISAQKIGFLWYCFRIFFAWKSDPYSWLTWGPNLSLVKKLLKHLRTYLKHCLGAIRRSDKHIVNIYTGWSKETVTSNLFLTGPEISKSAITQWFLQSLYREILVFWCFKIIRCVNFAFRSFSNKEHLLHHSRP